jgi:GntR family transcriptional regulator of vanillate catabolism
LDAALAAAGDGNLIAAYVEHNAAFHAGVCDLCRSVPLLKQIERVNGLPFASPSAFVALNSDPLGARHVFDIAQHQHRSLLEAIERRQGTRAEAIAREHARLSVTNLQRIFAGNSGDGTLPMSLLPHKWVAAEKRGARS